VAVGDETILHSKQLHQQKLKVVYGAASNLGVEIKQSA